MSAPIDRRTFLHGTAAGLTAAAAATAQTATQPATQPAVDESKLIWRSKSPKMQYRRLGRTNFMVSRIVQGWGGKEALWRRLLSQGVNYIDSAEGYGNFESELKGFLSRYRDKLWITSKATDVAGYRKLDDEVEKLYRKAMQDYLGESTGNFLALHKQAVEKQASTGEKPDLRPAGMRMAELYTRKLDASLKNMGIDNVDSYFMHGIEIPWMFDCVEIWDAYQKAHRAGKVNHFGYSVHAHTKEVLAAGVEANRRGPWRIDLIMPGVNPESFDSLKDELEACKKQDVGLIAMKTSGIKNRPVDGRQQRLEQLMGGREYNEFERAKLWMLHCSDDLIDAVIIGIKSNEEMEKDLPLASVALSAAAMQELRAIVRMEMAGACHLCGQCETNCPEHIEIANMIRYHAYNHQYNDHELARQLYAAAGYDPTRLCSNCGNCSAVCPSAVPIRELLERAARELV